MTEPPVSDFWNPTKNLYFDPETGDFEGALSDLWNARAFAKAQCGYLRHDHGAGSWLWWSGRRWEADRTGEVMRRAKVTVTDLHQQAVLAKRTDRDLIRHSVKSQSRNALVAMVDLARSEPGMPVTAEELDADPWLLNVANGTLDLKTGVLRDHRSDDLCTKLAPVEYDAKAPCPTWDAFLTRIFKGNAATIDYLQRALGYSLTGRMSEHVLHACWGTGANGKSTLLNTVAAMLGDYAQVLAADTLLRRKAGSASNDVAGLKGIRFALVTETPEGGKLNEPLVKQLTGGDKVRARALYQESIEFAPEAKYWIATNRKPVVSADDDGLWRRIRLVPFGETISEAERDPALPDKLLAELPGILAWAVRGCLAWQSEGLGHAAAVDAATAAYRTEMDSVALFLSEACVEGHGWVSASDLFNAYKVWADASGERAIGQRAFGLEMGRRGYEKKRSTGGSFRYLGVALREEGVEGQRAASERSEPFEPYLTNSLDPEIDLGELVDRGSLGSLQIRGEAPNGSLGGQESGETAPILAQTTDHATPCRTCRRPSVAGLPCYKCREEAA